MCMNLYFREESFLNATLPKVFFFFINIRIASLLRISDMSFEHRSFWLSALVFNLGATAMHARVVAFGNRNKKVNI